MRRDQPRCLRRFRGVESIGPTFWRGCRLFGPQCSHRDGPGGVDVGGLICVHRRLEGPGRPVRPVLGSSRRQVEGRGDWVPAWVGPLTSSSFGFGVREGGHRRLPESPGSEGVPGAWAVAGGVWPLSHSLPVSVRVQGRPRCQCHGVGVGGVGLEGWVLVDLSRIFRGQGSRTQAGTTEDDVSTQNV